MAKCVLSVKTLTLCVRWRPGPKGEGDSLVCHLRDVGAGWTERYSAHPRGYAATAGTSWPGLVSDVQVRFTLVCIGDEDSGYLCPL